MKPNPPIKGHELLGEGHIWRGIDPVTDEWGPQWGGCRCGAKPPDWPNVSVGAMKRWHRQHKAELRAQQ